jgi:hypothetical protein
MITQLEIQNFRGFSDYKIDDVGQVNLLVGTNNCGKTSVLEAIHLLKSRGDASVLCSLLPKSGRREEGQMDHNGGGELCRLFNGFRIVREDSYGELTEKSELSIRCIDKSPETVVLSIHEPDERQLGPFQIPINHQIGIWQLNVDWQRNENNNKQVYPLDHSGNLPYHYMKMYDTNSGKLCDRNIAFVPSCSLEPQQVVLLINKVYRTSDEELVLVVEALRIIAPDIVRLIPGSSGAIFVESSKWDDYPISIGSYGDGIWRLLGLTLSLVAAKNGTLLIDEIDTGLHHTVMSKMWKMICATAKKLNVQVFATTHSRDCWETLADNAVEGEFTDMPIRIHRINKDKKRATTFTNEEMHLALNRDVEVR